MWKQRVRTDEEGISLSRELTVCRNAIQRIRKTLQLFEQKHHKTTEVFMKEIRSGKPAGHPDLKDDYDAWQSSYESLRSWEGLEKQYQEACNMRKL